MRGIKFDLMVSCPVHVQVGSREYGDEIDIICFGTITQLGGPRFGEQHPPAEAEYDIEEWQIDATNESGKVHSVQTGEKFLHALLGNDGFRDLLQVVREKINEGDCNV